MAYIKKFIIENFRGIERTEIAIDNRVSTPIVTLVGLNESGKTTILEALSHFVTGDAVVAKMFEEENTSGQAITLIPIHKKANFSGDIKISALVELTDEDVAVFEKLASEKCSLSLDLAMLGKTIRVDKVYSFIEGSYNAKSSGPRWNITIRTKPKKSTKDYKTYSHLGEGPDLNSVLWTEFKRMLPTVAYFPTFLVDMPARIYLAPHADESPVNKHYRFVLQDILDSLGEGLNLDTHIVKKLVTYREGEENPYWLSAFLGTPGKGQVQAVVQKISNAVSREIIGSWTKIFQRPTSAKSVHLDWNVDTEKDNLPYVTFQISDGESQYALHERSLGFRWFFSFLIFTGFKQATNKQTIFLFDEPAANLHARAQTELLQSFARIVEGGHKVIYSTHSHHMIHPEWLSGAYIIENKAIDYDQDDELATLSTRQTNIIAHQYRTFVTTYPSRLSYYQPILERLGYVNPGLTPTKPVVITEGISDFHAFKVLWGSNFKKARFDLIPGLGAGASGPLISSFIGLGKPFVVLLDDDTKGISEAANYKAKWFLEDNSIITLASAGEHFKGKKLETFLSDETHKIICQHFEKKGSKASKDEIGIYFAEKAYTGLSDHEKSKETHKHALELLEYLNSKF